MTSRRELLAALGAGALGMPRHAFAQQPPPLRVGWISLDQAEGSPFHEPSVKGCATSTTSKDAI